jgi:dTDP-4-dehydrorhamnose 3,5-epimerase-like enzyme
MLEKVRLIDLPSVADSRGVLTAIESTRDIPIELKRIFYMHHITEDRGGHAHRDTDQVVVAISGSFHIELFDGSRSLCFVLDDPEKGLYIPRMVFITMSKFTEHAVCLVLANTFYDMSRSFRTREEYLNNVRQAQPACDQ